MYKYSNISTIYTKSFLNGEVSRVNTNSVSIVLHSTFLKRWFRIISRFIPKLYTSM